MENKDIDRLLTAIEDLVKVVDKNQKNQEMINQIIFDRLGIDMPKPQAN